VTAKTPLRFFVLTRQNFRTLLQQQPELEEKVMHALEERVRGTEQV
jgi:CRP-like cAMP-binding protein